MQFTVELKANITSRHSVTIEAASVEEAAAKAIDAAIETHPVMEWEVQKERLTVENVGGFCCPPVERIRKRVECCNCDVPVYEDDVIKLNTEALQCLPVGGEVPAGECPNCGAWVFVYKD